MVRKLAKIYPSPPIDNGGEAMQFSLKLSTINQVKLVQDLKPIPPDQQCPIH